jgi:DNA-binding CsgD family transcriptional regulator
MPHNPSILSLLRTRSDSGLPPLIRILERYGVPLLAYSSDGQRIHTSPKAARLLDDPACASALGRHADAVAAEELSGARSTSGFRNTESNCEVASVGGITLSFHWMEDRGYEPVALVVLRPDAPSRTRGGSIPGLSERQSEVAHLVARGLATKEIAARLGISAHTARHHVERIFSRLRVRSRVSLAAVVGSHESKIA